MIGKKGRLADPARRLGQTIGTKVSQRTKVMAGILAKERGLTEAEWLRMLVEREIRDHPIGPLEEHFIRQHESTRILLINLYYRLFNDDERTNSFLAKVSKKVDENVNRTITTLRGRRGAGSPS